MYSTVFYGMYNECKTFTCEYVYNIPMDIYHISSLYAKGGEGGGL